MDRQLIILSFGVGALILAAGHAFSQTPRPCAERAQVIERLASGYGEARHAIGLAANNHVMELYASEETGSWTVVMTTPEGVTCLVAAGQSYERIEAPAIDAPPKL